MIESFECDIAHGMIFRRKGSKRLHNFTMDVDPGYNYVGKIRGGVQWYMTGSKDFTSSISFEIKNENNHLVSYSDQSVTL